MTRQPARAARLYAEGLRLSQACYTTRTRTRALLLNLPLNLNPYSYPYPYSHP